MGIFVLDSQKVRVMVPDRERGAKKIPQYIRIGRSVIYPALNKLKSLQILNMAKIAKAVKRVLMPTIFSIGVPSNASPTEVNAAVAQYEKSINNFALGMRQNQDLSFAEVFQMAARIKMIPQFTDGKGQMQNLQVNQDNEADSIDKQEQGERADVALTLGFPIHYFVRNPDVQAQDKLTTLKAHSRYTRKGVSLQESVQEGVRDLIMLHFKHLKDAPTIDPRDIQVKFKSG